LGDETRRSLVGHTAQIGVGLRLADRCFELKELRLRLDKLLIEIRRGNHGEDIPLVNFAADIDLADANIAGGPGIERRAVECRHTARQIG
jgi:hypothetical protein